MLKACQPHSHLSYTQKCREKVSVKGGFKKKEAVGGGGAGGPGGGGRGVSFTQIYKQKDF